MSRRKQSNPQHVNDPPPAATPFQSTTRPSLSDQISNTSSPVLSQGGAASSQMDANNRLMTFESESKNNHNAQRGYEEGQTMDEETAADRLTMAGEYFHRVPMFEVRSDSDRHLNMNPAIWNTANTEPDVDAKEIDEDGRFESDSENTNKNGAAAKNYDCGSSDNLSRQMNVSELESRSTVQVTENMVQSVENGSVSSDPLCHSDENRYEGSARHLAHHNATEREFDNRRPIMSLKDDVTDQEPHPDNTPGERGDSGDHSPGEPQGFNQLSEYEESIRRFTEKQMMAQQQQERENDETDTTDKLEDTKEIEDIKDQVRRLQQQQMCQIQMLNYLHFQLAMVASTNQQPHQRPSPCFFPGSQQQFPGLNGMQIQNMLANAVANGPGGQPTTPLNGVLPNMANVLERQFANGELTTKKEASDPNECDERLSESSSSLEPKRASFSFGGEIKERALDNKNTPASGNGNSDDKQQAGFAKHACRYCQKIFGSDSALQIHLRSHTGERPYKCNICANRFSTRGNLKVHFIRHKSKYPNVEMNPHPVPEYLDNIPTDNGIPIGMSMVPDESDLPGYGSNDGNDRDSPSDSLFEQRDGDIGKYPVPSNQSDLDFVQSLKNPETENDSSSEQSTSLASVNESGFKHGNSTLSFPLFSAQEPHPEGDENRKVTEKMVEAQTAMESCKIESMEKKYAEKISASFTSPAQAQNRIPSSETKKLENLVNRIDHGKELEKNECHICRRVLSCQSALKLHYRTHTGERPYKCDLCSRAFTTRGNLRTHYSSVHRQQLRPSPPQSSASSRSSVLQCPLCGSRFMDQQSLQQHMHMHLYINSQQQQQQHQQQIARFIAGQQPGVASLPGYPPVSLPSTNSEKERESLATIDNGAPGNRMSSDQPEDDTSANDEVFEDQSPAQSFGTRATPDESSNGAVDSSPQPHRDALRKDSRDFHINGRMQPSALDLTRANSKSPSDLAMQGSDTEQTDVRDMGPIKTVSNPLSELAHLASSSAIMRPGGMSIMSLQASPPSDEARHRKMTTSCEICSKPFTCQSALEIHLRSHTKERPFVCRVCERGFTTKGNLKQHLLTHNITEVDDDMLEPVTSPIAGNSSNESPVSSPSMTNGSQTSGLKRPLESNQAPPSAKRTYPRHWCHICQKQFSSASSLQIHNRTHTGEKPFACSVCGRAFTTKGNLKVHMGTHVWGAGGSRRGRRISMDNPLISPWMQNTSNTAANPGLRPRAPQAIAAVPDPAAIYQQYAALASAGLMGVKATTDPRFHGNGILNLNNSAAARLLLSQGNGHVTPPGAVPSVGQTLNAIEAMKANDNKNISAAEWFWKAYQRTQEQVQQTNSVLLAVVANSYKWIFFYPCSLNVVS
uniref:Sal-like protein 3 n=1 Tax=Phallusia mammillata TaxID=59560 RepID=A0A6F9DRV6_9ASCI|nr:sal-like protein 3 [Phallusia mammillata]